MERKVLAVLDLTVAGYLSDGDVRHILARCLIGDGQLSESNVGALGVAIGNVKPPFPGAHDDADDDLPELKSSVHNAKRINDLELRVDELEQAVARLEGAPDP